MCSLWPHIGVVIQGDPEVELEPSLFKKLVKVTHNALSVGAKAVWKEEVQAEAMWGNRASRLHSFGGEPQQVL